MNINLLTSLILFVGLLVLAFFISIGVVLNHHWVKYGFNIKATKKLRLVYFGVAAFLLVVMLISAILYYA